MKDMNSINMERCNARNKYNEIVESNIKALCKPSTSFINSL